MWSNRPTRATRSARLTHEMWLARSRRGTAKMSVITWVSTSGPSGTRRPVSANNCRSRTAHVHKAHAGTIRWPLDHNFSEVVRAETTLTPAASDVPSTEQDLVHAYQEGLKNQDQQCMWASNAQAVPAQLAWHGTTRDRACVDQHTMRTTHMTTQVPTTIDKVITWSAYRLCLNMANGQGRLSQQP